MESQASASLRCPLQSLDCNALMKLLYDFFPIVLFFIAYHLFDIYVATAVAIAAAFVQTGMYWLRHRRFENTHLITLGLLVIFGGLTLALHDPVFIKWKPTLVNWLFAIAFVGSAFIGQKPLIKHMMGHAIALPDTVWQRLNWAWSLFFFIMGALNLYVAFSYAEETWVNFKLFGLLGLTLVFVVLQSFYLSRHIDPEKLKGEE